MKRQLYFIAIFLILILNFSLYGDEILYNMFGERLTKYRVHSAYYLEINSGKDAGTSYYFKDWDWFGNRWHNLYIFHYDEEGYGFDFKVGEELEKEFTSYTFKKADYDGLSLDFLLKKNKLYFIFGRTSNPVYGMLDPHSDASSSENNYILGGRYDTKLKIGDYINLNPGASVAAQFHHDGTIDSFKIKGVPPYEYRNPSLIYIKLEDDSPYDNLWVKYKNLKIRVNDGAYTTQLLSSAELNYVNNSIEVSHTLEIPNTSVYKIEIIVEAAGDYKISIKTDLQDDYIEAVSAPGNPPNTYYRTVTYEYLFKTGNLNYSFNLNANLLLFRINTEFAVNEQYYSYPSSTFDYKKQRYTAFYIDVSRKLLGINFNYSYYQIDSDYSTSLGDFNAVDDNDNNDEFKDDNYQQGYVFFDKNNNEVPDFYEKFLSYDVDLPFLEYGIDKNNNEIVDKIEDDEKPEYRYDVDLKGNSFSIGGMPVDNMEINVGLVSEKSLSYDGKNKHYYITMDYRKKLYEFIDLFFFNYFKIVKDTIYNKYLSCSKSDVNDRLLFQNSIYESPFVGLTFKISKRASVVSKLRLTYNYLRDEDRSIKESGGVLKGKYDLPIFRKWKLSFGAKQIFYRRKDYVRNYNQSVSSRVGMIMSKFNIVGNSALLSGISIIKSKDFYHPDLDHLKKEYSAEFVFHNDYGGARVNVLAGVTYKIVEYDIKKEQNEKGLEVYIKIHTL